MTRRIITVLMLAAFLTTVMQAGAEARPRKHTGQQICMSYPLIGGGFTIRCYSLYVQPGHGHGHAWGLQR